MINEIKDDANDRMDKSIEAFKEQLKKIRTGRAHPSLLEHVSVEYYGAVTPLSQVSNIGVEDARTLTVTVWEKDMVKVVEKAIMSSDLGLNPSSAGTVLRIPMPPLTEERRRDLVKVVKHEGENAKVAIRNIRRDANSDYKELLKEKEISEDDERKASDVIQNLTNEHVKTIDSLLEVKEQELMAV